MTKTKLALLVPMFVIACGTSGSSMTEPGTDMGAVAPFTVESGNYTASAYTVTNDCMDLPDAPFAGPVAVTNDGSGHLSLGTANQDGWSDATAHGLGTGTFTDSTHVTTTVSVDVTDMSMGSTCTHHLARNATVTVTADDTLQVQLMETGTSFMGTCPVTMDCTGSATFTLSCPNPCPAAN